LASAKLAFLKPVANHNCPDIKSTLQDANKSDGSNEAAFGPFDTRRLLADASYWLHNH
jgi:hypothetical protein